MLLADTDIDISNKRNTRWHPLLLCFNNGWKDTFVVITLVIGYLSCSFVSWSLCSNFRFCHCKRFYKIELDLQCFVPLSRCWIQGSKLAVAQCNQNVTWATWKRRKIAQLAIKNSSSPESLNYRLSICIVIVFLLPGIYKVESRFIWLKQLSDTERGFFFKYIRLVCKINCK